MSYNFLHDDTFDGSLLPMPTLHKAMWAFIVAKARPDNKATGGGSVLLNPMILKTYFPDAPMDEIRKVIEDFCDVDPESRTTDVEGRRLLPMGRDKYAIPTYTKHAGSRLARDAERKRQYRAERREQRGPGEPPPGASETRPVPPVPIVPRETPTPGPVAAPPPAAVVPSPRRGPRKHAPSIAGPSPADYERLLKTHAFVGDRIRIPLALHAQLVAQYGGNPVEASAALQSWYSTLNANLPPEEAIPNIWKWVTARFEAWVHPRAATTAPATPDEDAYARQLERSSARHHSRLLTPVKESK